MTRTMLTSATMFREDNRLLVSPSHITLAGSRISSAYWTT